MPIATVHHTVLTERKVISEESNTIELIFKEDNCRKNGCITQKKIKHFWNLSKFSGHIP